MQFAVRVPAPPVIQFECNHFRHIRKTDLKDIKLLQAGESPLLRKEGKETLCTDCCEDELY